MHIFWFSCRAETGETDGRSLQQLLAIMTEDGEQWSSVMSRLFMQNVVQKDEGQCVSQARNPLRQLLNRCCLECEARITPRIAWAGGHP